MLAGTYQFVFTLCFFWIWKLAIGTISLENLNLPSYINKAKKKRELKCAKFNITQRNIKAQILRIDKTIYCVFQKQANSKVQRHYEYTQNRSKSINHKPWPFEPVEVSFCFLRGHLESAKPSDYDCWAEKPQILTPFYMAGRIRNSWYKGLIVCQLLIFVLCFGFFNSELCELPPVTGPCRAAFPRWYYNSTAGKCLEFTYGGCMGNANSFDTDSNCTITCAPSVVAQKGLR